MSEEMKKVNETNEEMNETLATDQPKQETPAAEDKKSEKVGVVQKVKNFAKTKVIPAAKFVGKGLVKGASVAGGVLAMAYFIGAAAGGYAAAKGKASEESTTDQADETSSSESATEEKPADQDVQVVLNENNVSVDSNIE